MLREKYQKNIHMGRFFVLSCAVAAHARVGVSTFYFYNSVGQSSSLSAVNPKKGHVLFENRKRFDPSVKYGPGPTGVDFVPTVALDMILRVVPKIISIDFLKIDAQGHDLEIIKSLKLTDLRRISRVQSEVFLKRTENDYMNVTNSYKEWVDYMGTAGYELKNAPERWNIAYIDADWRKKD